MVDRFAGGYEAAIYGNGENFGKAARGLTGAVLQAFYPRIAKLKDPVFFLVFSVSSTVILICICLFVSKFSIEIITFLFGSNYIESAKYFNLFLIIIPLSYAGSLMGYPAFSIIDKTASVNNINLFGFIVFVLSVTYLFYGSTDPKNYIKSLVFAESAGLIIKITSWVKGMVEYKRKK